GSSPAMTNNSLPRLLEDLVALQVDDLARLVHRKHHRVIVSRVRVGADEAMLLAHAADLALDRAGGLIMAVVLVLRGANGEAFVLDWIGGFCRLGTPAKERAPKRHARSPYLRVCVTYLFRDHLLETDHTPRPFPEHPQRCIRKGENRCRKPIG